MDDNIDCEKEIKYLSKIENAFNKLKRKIDIILEKSPKYYYNSDDDTETDWEFSDNESDDEKCDPEIFKLMLLKASDKLKDARFTKGIVIIKKRFSD